MKILHLIDSGGLYGAEIMLLNLIEEQAKLGIEATVCSIAKPGEEEKPLETEAIRRGINVEKVRMKAGVNINGVCKILRFARANHFDLLHSHGYKPNILFGFTPASIRKLPIMATVHGWTNTGFLNRMSIYQWLDIQSLKRMDGVVLVSGAMRSHPKLRNMRQQNLFVIPNGIPDETSHSGGEFSVNGPESDQNEISDIIKFCGNGFIIGAVGRLSDEKGFLYLIEAISLLQEKNIDIRLLIIGEGYSRKSLQSKIDSFNLGNKILMPGYYKYAFRFMRYFDVFVISSLTEGLPISLLEAMCAGIPIVATSVGGIPEVLQYGKGGLLVEPENASALAEAISLIHDQPELRERMTAVSLGEVRANYSSSAMALKYSNIYRQIVKQ